MAISGVDVAQYDAAVKRCAVVQLAGWTTIVVRGADRAKFLHNMCTNDVLSLTPGDQCEAFITDVKGKIVGHVVILAVADELILVAVPDQASRLITHLERYIIREDVQLEDATSGVNLSLAIGPDAGDAINDALSDNAEPDAPGTPLFAPCRQIWPGGYWFAVPAGKEFLPEGASSCELATYHAIRVESGWPLFGVDFDQGALPQELGRDSMAIHFRKGCYLGQETIARIDALGHVNRRLATLKVAGDVVPAAAIPIIAEGQEVGAVSSAAWSPRSNAPLALAMLRRGSNGPGTKVLLGDHEAEVINTPAVPFGLPPAVKK